MTPEQEKVIINFVKNGLLCVANMYRAKGETELAEQANKEVAILSTPPPSPDNLTETGG